MKLSIPEIRKEAFEINTSIKNIKKMHTYQLELADAQERLEEAHTGTYEEITKAITLDDMASIERAEKFIGNILGLTKKEIEKLEELERIRFMNVQSKIILALQGYGEEQIDEMFNEEVETAEKKVQALKKEKSTTPTNL